MAAGLVNTLRQVGTATGVAVNGALYASRVTTATLHALAGLPAPPGAAGRLAAAVASGAGTRVAAAVPPAARAVVTHAARAGTASGLNDVLLAAAAFAALGAIVGFAYGPDPARRPPPSPAPGELSVQPTPAPHLFVAVPLGEYTMKIMCQCHSTGARTGTTGRRSPGWCGRPGPAGRARRVRPRGRSASSQDPAAPLPSTGPIPALWRTVKGHGPLLRSG